MHLHVQIKIYYKSNNNLQSIPLLSALVCYEKWQRQIVKDQDPMFVGDFLGTAMDILSRSWQLQQAINQIQKDENKAQFSVLPKKIKVVRIIRLNLIMYFDSDLNCT